MKNTNTRVLCVDLSKDVIDFLQKENLEVYDATLGPFVDTRKIKYRGVLPIFLDENLPSNLHEYSVVVQDLQCNRKTIDYDFEINSKSNPITDTENSFKSLCVKHPLDIFDPVPFGCCLINQGLEKRKGPLIKILFQSKKYEVTYYGLSTPSDSVRSIGRFSNYQSVDDFTSQQLSGDEVKLVDEYKLSHALFSGLEEQLSYSQTFYHPTVHKMNSYDVEPNPNFIPLLFNAQGDIISYAYFYKENITFVLPQIDDKKVLLERLFSECLYRHFSDLFSSQTKNTWLLNEEYELPEIVKLNLEKETAKQVYEETVAQKDKMIDEIRKKHAFLYAMLTESGDELVKNVKRFLEWLGFGNVVSMDETLNEGEDFQEDLQVHLDNKELLIVEVKGLYGTSKDSECSQISKIENRRSHERMYSLVHSLYIVNNERGKEPLKRQIPPFTDAQIKDAEYGYRAMAYTYQLFNLYFEIKDEILTKEEARNAFLHPGLVDFHANFKDIGSPYKYFKGNKVICIELHDTTLTVGEIIYFQDNKKKLNKVKIVNLQVDKQDLTIVKDGKVGIEFNVKIPKGVEFYVRKNANE